MEIKRLKAEIVKINKKDRKGYNFLSSDKFIDTIELDESLFTHYYKKWSKSKEDVFATDDFIKVEFEHDKDIIEKTIKVDNIEYVFYLASANDLKKIAAMFIKKDIADTLGADLIKYTTGNIVTRLEGKDVVINKIQAYISLMFSGAIKTNLKPNIVVIEELKYKYQGLHTILKNIETLEFGEEVIETELISHDGQGIISKEFAEKIRKELNSKRAENKQIKYIDWITFRLFPIGGKGMCITVDIKEQLEKVWSKYGDSEGLKKINGKLYIKDIYNQWHDIESVDMILNESQTKLIKYFGSNKDIEAARESIPDDFKEIVNSLYVCKYNENNLRTDRTKLNYQFTQALALTKSDIVEITKNDRLMLEQALTDIDSMLIVNNLVDIKDINEDLNSTNAFNLSLDLVKYDESFLKDKTVLEQIRKLYVSKIKKLCYGKVFINDMTYRLIVQDPQVYLNFIATRDMETARDKSCLQAKEISVVGRPAKQRTVIGRNPLSSHQEMIRFENTRNSFIDSLGYKSNSMIVVNSYDALLHRMSGADTDGDTAAVIIDDTIYNSVIELNTPIFFNTFDGAKVESKYTRDNIIAMTKITAGNQIESLAINNAGLMNKINELPYFDKRINKNIFLDELFKQEQEELLKTWDMESNLRELTWKKINELESEGTIVNCIFSMPDQEIKEYIKSQHKKYRYSEYLILLAQQMAIDCSKTGLDIPEHIKDKLKTMKERPYFICFTGSGRRFDKYRNSILDCFARYTYREFNSKKIKLLNDIDIEVGKDVTEDKSFKNTNVIRNLFKRAAKEANDTKVNILVDYIKPKINKYNQERINLRHYKNTDRDYYQSAHETMSNNMKRFFKGCYNNCKNNINDFTLEDLSRAIYLINMSSKLVLEFLPELLIHNVVKMNDKKKVFIKGDLNDGSKVITLGNKEYTLVYEDIKKEEVETIVFDHSLQDLRKKKMNEGSMLQMKSHYGINFNLDQKYILKRKADNKFLFDVIDLDGVIIDEVRLSIGAKEFKEDIEELNIIVESYKCESKTKKYEYWFIKRCAV